MPPYSYDDHGRRVVTPSKGELRERAILEAAEKQLTEVGVEGMTVESIATAAGITRAALYRYFRSRNDVLAELVRQTVAALHESVDQLPTGQAEPPERLIRLLIERTAQMWREHGAVMRAGVELAMAVDSVREAWGAASDAVTVTGARIAARAGLPDTDDESGANVITRTLVQMTERSFYEASKADADLDLSAATNLVIWLRALLIER